VLLVLDFEPSAYFPTLRTLNLMKEQRADGPKAIRCCSSRVFSFFFPARQLPYAASGCFDNTGSEKLGCFLKPTFLLCGFGGCGGLQIVRRQHASSQSPLLETNSASVLLDELAPDGLVFCGFPQAFKRVFPRSQQLYGLHVLIHLLRLATPGPKWRKPRAPEPQQLHKLSGERVVKHLVRKPLR